MISALWGLGRIAVWQGRFDLLDIYTTERYILAKEIGDTVEEGVALLDLMHVAFAAQDEAKALHIFEQIMRICDIESNNTGVATILQGTGHILMSIGDLRRAIPLLKRSVERIQMTKDELRISWMVYTYGNALIYSGQYAQARALFADHVRLLEPSKGRSSVLADLSRLALIDVIQGRGDAAGASVQEVITLSHASGDLRRITGATTVLGHLRQRQRRTHEACALFQTVLELHTRTGEDAVTAEAQLDLAQALLADGAYQEAKTCYREALVLCQRACLFRLLPDLLEGLALLRLRSGDAARAVPFWGAAKRLRTTMGIQRWPVDEPHYLAHLAEARATLGDDLFTQRWHAGQELSLMDALNTALEAVAA